MKKISIAIVSITFLFYPNSVMAQTPPAFQGRSAQEAPAAAPELKSEAQSPADGAASQNSLITVDFTNADIRDVLQIMALKGNVNIVAGPEVVGAVTIHLTDVPWESALDTIVRTYGFTYEQDGNIYHIFSPTSPEGTPKPEEVRTEAVTLQYAQLTQVKAALVKSFPLSKIDLIKGTNQLIISDTPSNLKKIQKMIHAIDTRQPQVYIEAKIIRTELTRREAMGVDWNAVARFAGSKRPTTFPFAWDAAKRGPDSKLKQARLFPVGQTQILNSTTSTATGATGTSQTVNFKNDFAFPFAQASDFIFGTLDFSQFTAVLQILNERQNTKTISNPRVVTSNNKTARIRVGGEVGIPSFELNEQTGTYQATNFDLKPFGIILTVKPHITEKREILLQVKPEISNFDGFETITDTGLSSPKFTNIDATTNVLVHNGDTLMIGGLITDNAGDARNKIPALNRIPILGWAFKSFHRSPQGNNKSETIFFITVNLVDDVFNKKAELNWQKTEKEYEDYQKYSEEEYFEKSKRQKKKEMKKAEAMAKAKAAAEAKAKTEVKVEVEGEGDAEDQS